MIAGMIDWNARNSTIYSFLSSGTLGLSKYETEIWVAVKDQQGECRCPCVTGAKQVLRTEVGNTCTPLDG